MIGYADITFNFTLDLSRIIRTTELPHIENNEEKTILEEVIKYNNTNISREDIDIINITKNGCTLRAKENFRNKYKGKVDITFKLKEDLQKIIKITNLGKINIVSSANIVAKINSVNNLSLINSKLSVEVTSVKTRAKISATSFGPYYNTVYVKFNM